MGFEEPTRELDIGEILGQTFNLYFTKFWLFFIPFLVAGAITGAWGAVVGLIFPMPEQPSQTAPVDVQLSYLFSMLGILLITVFLTVLFSWIINTIANGMAVRVASDTLKTRSIDLSGTLNVVAARLPSLLITGIITGILIAIGLVCLIIPGIILAIMFSLTVPAIVIEEVDAFQSLSRSRQLVGGRWLKTFGLLLVVYLIIIVAGLIFGAISNVFGPLSWLIGSFLSALAAPILPIATTLYYYSMIAREQPGSPAPSTPQPSMGKIHCVYCGTENKLDAVFCQKCGKRIEKQD